eukprot:COSAG05_NODE_4397_length_1531_cov_1.731844_1_plen_78_part_10
MSAQDLEIMMRVEQQNQWKQAQEAKPRKQQNQWNNKVQQLQQQRKSQSLPPAPLQKEKQHSLLRKHEKTMSGQSAAEV